MGNAESDIKETFTHLDSDASGTLDLAELMRYVGGRKFQRV
jgi:hypothetical protein